MDTYNAFYVRKQASDDATRAEMRSLYPRAQIQVLPDFIGAILSRGDIEPPEQRIAELSAKLATDIIWVTSQTTSESFIFHHWRAGEQLRVVWFGCSSEGTWERAEGQPEPWETGEFWSEEALEDLLECAESDSERQKLQRLWKEKVIRKGETEPSVSGDDAVQAVMEHYGLFSAEPALPTVSPQEATRAQRRRNWGCVLIILFWIALAVAIVIRIVQRFT